MPVELIQVSPGQGAQAYGSVAEALLKRNMDVSALRTNTVLRKDEWALMDDAVLQANRSRLIGVADLKKRGLTYSIGNGLATMVLEYEKVSKLGRANMNMDGEAQGRRDRLTFEVGYLPLPIIYQDFSINARVLAASRLHNSKLDTTTAEAAGRSVAEELERMLFLGTSSFSFGSGTIYGYLDAPHRCTGTFVAWDAASGADPVEDVIAMKQALISKGFYGPFVVYIPTSYETALDKNYVSGAAAVNITVRERILKIGQVESVTVADYLTSGNIVMVCMQKDVIRMVTGMPLRNVEWMEGAGMRTNFKVMTIDIPQIRYDKDGNCGIAHYAAI